MDKDTKKVIAEAERQGFAVTETSRGHVMAKGPNGGICVTGGTPGDRRGLLNFIACLRGLGFIWRPKGRKGSGRGQ